MRKTDLSCDVYQRLFSAHGHRRTWCTDTNVFYRMTLRILSNTGKGLLARRKMMDGMQPDNLHN